MKHLILSALIAVSAIGATYAQDSTRTRQHRPKLTAEQRAERASSALASKLELSADQKKKVYDIELKRIARFEADRKAEGTAAKTGDRKAGFEKRKALMAENKRELESVLTAKQKTKLDSLQAAQRDKMRERFKDLKGKKSRRPDSGRNVTSG